MPFVSSDDEPRIDTVCGSPEHLPPGHVVLKPGLHVWACPACGRRVSVIVGQTRLSRDEVMGAGMPSPKKEVP